MTDTGEPLIDYLVSLAEREDRAALAALRSSLREGHDLDGLRIVLPFVRGASPARLKRAEDDALLLGALFALHPEQGALTLAEALARVWRETGSDSVEGRFRALLSADREQLAPHLRHAISLVASKHLAIDWADLYRAIKYWDRADEPGAPRSPRRRWASDFWTSEDGAGAPSDSATTPDHEATP